MGILVVVLDRLQFLINSFLTFIYNSNKKMKEELIKTFLTDSQPGYFLSMF